MFVRLPFRKVEGLTSTALLREISTNAGGPHLATICDIDPPLKARGNLLSFSPTILFI
jgi:hypothetical protein